MGEMPSVPNFRLPAEITDSLGGDIRLSVLDRYFLVSDGEVPRYMLKEYEDPRFHLGNDPLEAEMKNIEAFHASGIEVPLPVAIDREQRIVFFPYVGVNFPLAADTPLLNANKRTHDEQSRLEAVVKDLLRQLAAIHTLDCDKIASKVCTGACEAEEYILPYILNVIRDNESWLYGQLGKAGFKWQKAYDLSLAVWKDQVRPRSICKYNMYCAESVFVGKDGKVTIHDLAYSRKGNPLTDVTGVMGWGAGDDAGKTKWSRVKEYYLHKLNNNLPGYPPETEGFLRSADCFVLTDAVNMFDIILGRLIKNDFWGTTPEKLKVICRLSYQNLTSPMSEGEDILELTDMFSAPLGQILRSQGIDV